MELTEPPLDCLALAHSTGVPAERARTVSQSVELLEQGLANGRPTLIEVELDPAFRPG